MPLSKISRKRQVVIPENIFNQLGAQVGDYVEFVQKESEVFIKIKKLVDINKTSAVLPPAPSYEERMSMLKDLEGNAEDDSFDIPLDEIKASRTRKELPLFDE